MKQDDLSNARIIIFIFWDQYKYSKRRYCYIYVCTAQCCLMRNGRHSKARGTHTVRDFDVKVEIVQDNWLYHSTSILEKWSHCQNTVWLSLSPVSLFVIFRYARLCSLFFLINYSRKGQKALDENGNRTDDSPNY